MLINYAGRIHGEKPFATIAESRILAQVAFHLVEFVKQIAILALGVDDRKLLVIELALVAADKHMVKCFV